MIDQTHPITVLRQDLKWQETKLESKQGIAEESLRIRIMDKKDGLQEAIDVLLAHREGRVKIAPKK